MLELDGVPLPAQPACGTPLRYLRERYEGFVDITTCSLADPEPFPPTHHSWLTDDVHWVKFGDGLPVFQESRPRESDG